MNKTKQGYVTPLSDLLVVRFEGAFLTGSLYGAKGAAGQQMVDDDDYNYSL